MRRLRSLLFPSLALALFGLFACRTADIAEGARAGLALAFGTAIPALFPFFVAVSLLVSSGALRPLAALCAPLMRLFRLPGVAAGALLPGLFGGYPAGAQAACLLYQSGALTKEDTLRLLTFCNNAGPAFVLGICGLTVCGSVRTGAFLLTLHIVSALLTGLLLARRRARGASAPVSSRPDIPAIPFAQAFPEAVQSAMQTALCVAAFITFFSVLLSLLPAFVQTLPPAYRALLCGLLELTNGLSQLSGSDLPPAALLPLVSGLLAFGGLSVHCQTLALLHAVHLPFFPYLRGKTVQALLSAFLCSAACSFLPQGGVCTAAFLPLTPSWNALRTAFLLFFALVLLLLPNSSGKRRKNHI